MAIVGTSTTTASRARLHSVRRAKYRAGFGGLMRFTAKFTSPVAGTIQYIGLADGHGSTAEFINGLTVGYNGITFGFQRWQNDVFVEEVTQANWDDPMDGTGLSGMTLDQTKLNVFEIRFQYLGAGAMELSIEDDSTGKFVVAHTMLYTNLNTTPSTYSPNYILMIHVHNFETTSNMVLSCASYAYLIEGKTTYTEVQQPLFSSGKQSTGSITTELAIFTIRNKVLYASKTNYIDIVLEAISAGIEAGTPNNLGEIRVVKDATLGDTPSYANINTSDSVIDMDVAGTTVTGGRELFSFQLAGKNDKIFHGVQGHRIYLAPGETLTVSAISSGSATVNASLLWKELF